MQKLFILFFFTSLFISCKQKKEAEKHPLSTAEKIANHYGYQNWNDVSELHFTFNVLRGGNTFSRSWNWNKKTGDVKMTTATDTIQYNRNSIDSLSQKFDKAFINDKYWLMAPFNLVSDMGVSFSEKQDVIAPISKDTLQQLTISYGNEGGYTPGDAYDFFYNSDYEIKEWNFRKGNAKKTSLSTTWEKNKSFKNITFSTSHQDPTGLFRVFFTNISVQ